MVFAISCYVAFLDEYLGLMSCYWCSTDKGDYMLDSEDSAKAFFMFDELLKTYNYDAELQCRDKNLAVIAVNRAAFQTWYVLQLVGDSMLDETLEADSIHECAKKFYDHISKGKYMKFGEVIVGSKSPGVGKFMMDFVLQGL